MSKKSKRGGHIRFCREVTYNLGLEYCDAVICKVTAPRRARRALGKPTSEAQKIVNERNAKLKLRRLANANFAEDKDYYITLTFDEPNRPETREEVRRAMNLYLRRVKYAWKKAGIKEDFRWLYVIEGDDGKRLHVHVLMSGGMPASKLKELWGLAVILNVKILQAGNQGFAALCIYLTKQGKLEDGERRWYGSRTLVDPIREELNAKTPMEEVEELGEYIDTKMYADVDVIPTSERFAPVESRYPGYYCSEASAKYIKEFGEWVISVQLYRVDTPMGKAEKRRREKEEETIRNRKEQMARLGL